MNCLRRVPLVVLLLAGLATVASAHLVSTGSSQPASGKPVTRPAEPLRTAVDRPIDIQDIRLDLRVDLPKKIAEGTATLQLRSLRPLKRIELDAVGFKINQVTLSTGNDKAQPVKYQYDNKKLTIPLNPAWPVGKDATLHIDYRIEKPKSGLHFFGPTVTEPETPLCVWSDGEPISNRYWFPCIDEPDERQTTQLVVTVPEGFEVLSNGKLLSRKPNPTDKTVTFDWRQDKEHPAYLVTMVVGQFDVVREEWDTIPVLYYVPKGCANHVAKTFGRTREMLTFFSKRFGIHYPWDKYAQVIAYRYGGGMENTSATTLGDLLKDENSALDPNADGTIAHELAHQWWGDLVTCRDWAHLWLNEGFATYAEALWQEYKNGPDAYSYNMLQQTGGAIVGGKNRPVVDRHYRQPISMFDGRAYPKGSWILHMLRYRIGDDAFWRSVQRYGTEHRLKSVETSDFRRTVERESGYNLERFFYDWTERPGCPTLEVTTTYTSAPQQAKIVVKQTQKEEPFHFPLTVNLYSSETAKPIAIQEMITEREHTFTVPLTGTLTMVEVDPEQTVLAELKENKERALWAAQLQSSSLPARLRAVRYFQKIKTDEDRELLTNALAKEKFWGVQIRIISVLAASGDKSRDILLQYCHHSHLRVRLACIQGFSSMKSDPSITTALEEILRKGDPSYSVSTAAMSAYGKHKGKDAIALLTSWLTRPSYRDTLRSSALNALGQTQDAAAVEPLLTYAKPGHPRNTRTSAVRGLVSLTQKTKLTEEQHQQVLAFFTTSLEDANSPVNAVIIAGLNHLGSMANSLLSAVDKLSRNTADEGVRRSAKKAAERLRAKEKPKKDASSSSSEVIQLREEVERLKRECAELRKRLQEMEKNEKKAGKKPLLTHY